MPTTPIPDDRMVRVAPVGLTDGRQCCRTFRSIKEYPAMKTIISALIALSVLTGLAASASAFDAKGFYEELDRSRT